MQLDMDIIFIQYLHLMKQDYIKLLMFFILLEYGLIN